LWRRGDGCQERLDAREPVRRSPHTRRCHGLDERDHGSPGPGDLLARPLWQRHADLFVRPGGRSAGICCCLQETLERFPNRTRQIGADAQRTLRASLASKIIAMSDSVAAAKTSSRALVVPQLLSTAAITGGAAAETMPCGRASLPM